MQETRQTSGVAKRIAITLFVGIFVFIVAYIAAWREMGWSPYVASYRMAMRRTLGHVATDIETYRNDTGNFPATLKELAAHDGINLEVDKHGNVIDHWKNPVSYSLTEDGFIVCSLGRDGARGGRGVDGDLCMDGPNNCVNNSWMTCAPTFWQFAFELNTKGMLRACVGAAFLAMAFYYNLSGGQRKKGERESVVANVIVTVVFSLIIAAVLVVLHAPTGH